MSENSLGKSPVASMPPLLVRDAEAARLLGVSPSHFSQHLWNSASFGPRPYRIGGASRVKLWRVSDLQRWVDLGLPDREKWLLLKLDAKISVECGFSGCRAEDASQSVGRGGAE